MIVRAEALTYFFYFYESAVRRLAVSQASVPKAPILRKILKLFLLRFLSQRGPDGEVQTHHQHCGRGNQKQCFFEAQRVAAGDGADDAAAHREACPAAGDDEADGGA